MQKKKYFIALAGLATLFLLGCAGVLLLLYVHELKFQEIFFQGAYPVLHQCIAGLVYGFFSSLALLFLLKRKYISPAKDFFVSLIYKFKVSLFDILFISFCAGVGEEIFFRGAIQPWLGIWPTAYIFILLHGYLNMKNKPLFIYGSALFIVSAGFGYLMVHAGLWAAATAHFLIDVLLLFELRNDRLKENNEA